MMSNITCNTKYTSNVFTQIRGKIKIWHIIASIMQLYNKYIHFIRCKYQSIPNKHQTNRHGETWRIKNA